MAIFVTVTATPFFCPLTFGQKSGGDDDFSAAIQDEWVVDVRPGVRRYGKTNEFSSLGVNQAFDASPTGDVLAFSTGVGIKLWSTSDKKVIRTFGGNNSQRLVFSHDGEKLFSQEWQPKGGQIVVAYDVSTGEKLFSIDPKEDFKNFNQSEQNGESLTGDSSDDDGESSSQNENEISINFYVRQLAVSPEGEKMAICGGRQTIIYDLARYEAIRKIEHESYLQTLTFLDENRLVIGNGKIFDCETGESENQLPKRVFKQYLNMLRRNPVKENLIASTQWGAGIILYDLERKKQIELETSGKEARNYLVMEFSPDGSQIAAASYENFRGGTNPKFSEIHVWDAESGRLNNVFKTKSSGIGILKFSHDSKWLYSKANLQFGVRTWDLAEKEITVEAVGHSSPIQNLAFSPDGESMLTAASQGSAILFELDTGEPVKSIPCQQATHIRFVGERFAVVAANYNSVTVFDRKKNRTRSINVKSFSRPSVIAQLGGFLSRKRPQQDWENYAISSIEISDDREHLITALRGQTNFRIEKYALASGKSVARSRFKSRTIWPDDEGAVENDDQNPRRYSQMQWVKRSFATSPEQQLAAILNDKLELVVLDGMTGEIVYELGNVGQHSGMSQLFFSPDESALVFSDNKSFKVWDMNTGEEVDVETDLKGAKSVCFSDDGQSVAVLSYNPTRVVVLNTDDWSERFVSEKTKNKTFNAIALSNDANRVAVSNNKGQFEVWELSELE